MSEEFIIDCEGDSNLFNSKYPDPHVSEDENDTDGYSSDNNVNDIQFDFSVDLKKVTKPKKSKQDPEFSLTNTYFDTGIYNRNPSSKYGIRKFSPIDEVMSKSVLQPGFEKLHSVPSLRKSETELKKERRKEREKTKGKQWYHLPATEVTDEIKHDLEILKMRSVIDTKHFYKKNDITVTPKYFHIGTVIDNPADFYSDRVPKSQRKKTLVDELMAEAEVISYNKKKFKEIVDENRRKKLRKVYVKAKKLKKKKK